MPIVETMDLVRHHRLGRHDVRALDGISLGIERGEFVAVMGRSGSGKSTLLNLVGCLDRPTSGAVMLDGVEVSGVPERDLPRIRREKVGFIFQHFNLIPALTAVENVALPLKYAGVSSAVARGSATAMLEAVEMADRLSHRPGELSGGEQQRVAIARALVNEPAVVLADEPTGEVDSETAATIIRLMRDLNRSLGQTFLIVTHDSMVTDQTSRVIRLRDGRIESDTAVSG